MRQAVLISLLLLPIFLSAEGASKEKAREIKAELEKPKSEEVKTRESNLAKIIRKKLVETFKSRKDPLRELSIEGETCWVSIWIETVKPIVEYPDYPFEFGKKIFWMDCWTVLRSVFENEKTIKTVMISGSLPAGAYGKKDLREMGTCGVDREEYLRMLKIKNPEKDVLPTFGTYQDR